MGWLKISIWDRQAPWVSKRVWRTWEHPRRGNMIQFVDFKTRRLLVDLPEAFHVRVDDEIQARTQTGRIARFRVVELDYGSSEGAFYATVTDVGYTDGQP